MIISLGLPDVPRNPIQAITFTEEYTDRILMHAVPLPITKNNLDHLIKLVSARFFHYKVTIFPLYLISLLCEIILKINQYSVLHQTH